MRMPRHVATLLSFIVGMLVLFAAPWGGTARAQMLQLPGDAPSGSLASAGAAPNGAPTRQPPHALALRARWVTVPSWQLLPYTDARTSLDGGWSVGLEYLYLRNTFDVVVSVDYSWLNAQNGNFLAKGHDPRIDTHFIAFDRLGSISADVSIIGHWNLTPWMEFRIGAGLGLGVVLGEIYQITSNTDCSLDNVGDLSKCYPRTMQPRAAYDVSRPLPDQANATVFCNADLSDSTLDTASMPCLRRVNTYPMTGRVVPVLNTLIGFRFKAHRNLYLHLETGWRLVGFYLGAGPEFRF